MLQSRLETAKDRGNYHRESLTQSQSDEQRNWTEALGNDVKEVLPNSQQPVRVKAKGSKTSHMKLNNSGA
jgi:hypothetical protein